MSKDFVESSIIKDEPSLLFHFGVTGLLVWWMRRRPGTSRAFVIADRRIVARATSPGTRRAPVRQREGQVQVARSP